MAEGPGKMPIFVNRIVACARKLLGSGTSLLIQYNGVLPQPVLNSLQPRAQIGRLHADRVAGYCV
jgi:hypothetical protein